MTVDSSAITAFALLAMTEAARGLGSGVLCLEMAENVGVRKAEEGELGTDGDNMLESCATHARARTTTSLSIYDDVRVPLV